MRRPARIERAAASSVSCSAACARPAASAGVQGGQSRVFTRPGTGALAITISAGSTE